MVSYSMTISRCLLWFYVNKIIQMFKIYFYTDVYDMMKDEDQI